MNDKRRIGRYAFSLFLFIPRKSHCGVFACENGRRQTFGFRLGFHDDINRLLRFLPRHQKEKEKKKEKKRLCTVEQWNGKRWKYTHPTKSQAMKRSISARSLIDPSTTPTPSIQSRSSELLPSPDQGKKPPPSTSPPYARRCVPVRTIRTTHKVYQCKT